LYFSPLAASRSAVGVLTGPPKAPEAPKPTSSSNTTRTFGAPAGGRSGSIAEGRVWMIGLPSGGALAATPSSPVWSASANHPLWVMMFVAVLAA
jgi:hypothetical protein